jgi:hypothetical protein
MKVSSCVRDLRERLNFKSPLSRASDITKKVAKRGWSLEKFTKSVTAQAKRLDVKIGSATRLKKAYEDGA